LIPGFFERITPYGKVAVIDAGIVGVSISRQVAKDRSSVTIYDAGNPSCEATRAAF